jgi:plastocyanin
MLRIRILLGAALVVLALAVAGAVQASTQSTVKLVGKVGPGFTITLTKSGTAVKTLKAGTYTITVSDKASIHNFHLFGPGGVNKKTGVSFTGTKTWTVKLVKGKYTYRCDIHFASGMIGHFTVK